MYNILFMIINFKSSSRGADASHSVITLLHKGTVFDAVLFLGSFCKKIVFFLFLEILERS